MANKHSNSDDDETDDRTPNDIDQTTCPNCGNEFPNHCILQDEYHCLQCGTVWDSQSSNRQLTNV